MLALRRLASAQRNSTPLSIIISRPSSKSSGALATSNSRHAGAASVLTKTQSRSRSDQSTASNSASSNCTSKAGAHQHQHQLRQQTAPRRAFTSTAPASMEMNLTGDPNQHDADKFSESLTGGCLCGSIRVTIRDGELFSRPRGHLCHCANCRKVAGSYVASNLIIEEDKVDIVDRDGSLKEYVDKETGSGNALSRFFCGNCGNPVKSVTPAYAGKVVMKMGMFPRIPQPEFETFGDHRHAWQASHQGIPKYRIKAGQEKTADSPS